MRSMNSNDDDEFIFSFTTRFNKNSRSEFELFDFVDSNSLLMKFLNNFSNSTRIDGLASAMTSNKNDELLT